MRSLAFLKRPKAFIPLTVIILLSAAVVLAVHNLNAPAEGSINQTPPSKSEIIDPYANPGKYNGKYLSFTYPAHYKQIPSQKSGSYLEVVGFYSTDQTSKQISVGVLNENLDDDSGIVYRKLHPEIYHQEPRTRLGAVIFSKSAGGMERTAYLSHGSEVASLSLTAPPGAIIAPDLDILINSLAWKQ